MIKLAGGKCACCGYDRYDGALEFHHLDPAQKDFGMSKKGTTKSLTKLIVEIRKCILVCSICHREIEGGVRQLPTVIPEIRDPLPEELASNTDWNK